MSYFGYNNIQYNDQILVQRVIDNLKPGCGVSETVKLKGLINIRNKMRVFISRPKKVREFFDLDLILENFSTLGEVVMNRCERLYGKIKNKPVAKALKYLNNMPREDKEFPQSVILNGERPEVALLEGLLYGYPLKEIEMYVEKKINPRVGFIMLG